MDENSVCSLITRKRLIANVSQYMSITHVLVEERDRLKISKDYMRTFMGTLYIHRQASRHH